MRSKTPKILILGACGQIGVELTLALRSKYGSRQVIATDLKEAHPLLAGTGPFHKVDATNAAAISELVKKEDVTQIYLLAALLSATAERKPKMGWDINMQSLLQVLEIGVQYKLDKIYWPSSIAIFGPTTPGDNTPQQTIVEPTSVYGISKYAGELWCQYYRQRYGLDVRGLRYPGLISWKAEPGGGTTDYAIDIFHGALKDGKYTCFLAEDSYLPMMYMDDAIRATLELMEAPQKSLSTALAYNVSAMSFSPAEIAEAIKQHIPEFEISYAPDYRQDIANGWPASIDDSLARKDWAWKEEYDLEKTVKLMLKELRIKNCGYGRDL